MLDAYLRGKLPVRGAERGVLLSFLVILLLLGQAQALEPDSALERLRNEFQDPPREHSQYPFWFWNDALTEEGILRQIAWMEEKGVYGFTIHARMGLSREVGYMTDRWLELVKLAVDEAQRRRMRVYLYDEGMYPSGSAHGSVAAGRPDLASQGLRMTSEPVSGPQKAKFDIPVQGEEQLVAVVLMERDRATGKYLSNSSRILPNRTKVRCQVPPGDWELLHFIQTPSRGVIRGVHFDEEDNLPGAPPSADLLNPEATARFIEETHEKYYRLLAPHFGGTVEGIFTDEPSILGRRAKPGLLPWTRGFLGTLSQALGYEFTSVLPLLWREAVDGGEKTARFDYHSVVAATLNESYYQPLYEWCDRHGVALTGHPADSGEMKPQVYFHQPGQDVVWRWVVPGKGMEGPHSVIGKSAASMAAHLGRTVVTNEAYGAYGWQLTMDEMKWLADWLFVRGTNRLLPHAFYYSVEGERIHERPPDVGWNNLWWEHYGLFSRYTNRLSWLMSGGVPVADVAVLTVEGHTPWRAAKNLFETQKDFFYLDESLLAQGKMSDGRLQLGGLSYPVIVLDAIGAISPEVIAELLRMIEGGIHLIAWDSPLRSNSSQPEVIRDLDRIRSSDRFHQVKTDTDFLRKMESLTQPDLTCTPATPDLRYGHRIKDGIHFYLLVNEGEEMLRPRLSFNQISTPEMWDAESGSMKGIEDAIREGDRVQFRLTLHPRQSKIVVFDSAALRAGSADLRATSPAVVTEKRIELSDLSWSFQADGRRIDNLTLGDWTELPDFRSFAGVGWYEASFELPLDFLEGAAEVILDCGDLQSFAQIAVNGRFLGARLWRPFHFDIGDALKPGVNHLKIGVTNTRAGALTPQRIPSGLFGPVQITAAK
jgi:hypothetical protein